MNPTFPSAAHTQQQPVYDSYSDLAQAPNTVPQATPSPGPTQPPVYNPYSDTPPRVSFQTPSPRPTPLETELGQSNYGHRPSNSFGSTSSINHDYDRPPAPTRTPSPTPSERKALETPSIRAIDIRNAFKKKYIGWWLLFAVMMTIVILISVFNDQIVEWLTPVTRWLQSTSWGWVIPIILIAVLSIPPLFGSGIVAILCGLVWGLWIGFGIVAAGQFFGEIINFYLFKYCCIARAQKTEKKNITYACMAKVIRDGGFLVALIVRWSSIPEHFSTAIFATTGIGLIPFSIAVILSLPKNMVQVYLGVILDDDEQENKKAQVISNILLAVTIVISIAAYWYIMKQMDKVKPEVVYQKRKERQAKMLQGLYYPDDANESQLERGTDEDRIPLTGFKTGRTNSPPGFNGDKLHAPRPQHGYSSSGDWNETTEQPETGNNITNFGMNPTFPSAAHTQQPVHGPYSNLAQAPNTLQSTPPPGPTQQSIYNTYPDSAQAQAQNTFPPPSLGARPLTPLGAERGPAQSSPYHGHQPSNSFSSTSIPDNSYGRSPPLPLRTPSPTPSEREALETPSKAFNIRKYLHMKYIWYWVAAAVALVIFILITVFDDQIVEWLTPVSKWLKETSWGWIIPVLLIAVLSIPPLFGSGIVAILCGLVWGLWIGFGIVAAGQFIGEIINYYLFKYFCGARAQKFEKKKITYAALAKVIRDGGFKVALIVRWSFIPEHFATAIFATCGVKIIPFALAVLLSLPKSILQVYLGVIFDDDDQDNKKSKLFSGILIAVTVAVSVGAYKYIMKEMDKVKPEVVYQRRKERQAKMLQGLYYPGDTNESQLERGTDEDRIPLTGFQASRTNSPPRYDGHKLQAPRPQHGYSSSGEWN
ncbi:hypothetical protein V5O48_000429 [Marasmius crinis-equi]|uniref:Golgi apparatus membrane protein TVP38 n=1 Tax=Marasmius crinis-equi TaxID=585013 RepID=A0ABR3G180_9AGAR